MVSKSYYNRIALSKARLDNSLADLAKANSDMTVAEFVALARKEKSTAITDEYAASLLISARMAVR